MTLDQLSNLIKDPKLFGILIVRPFGLLLQWLYSIVQNYGIAVILFALLVKLVCIPLTIKSKKSTRTTVSSSTRRCRSCMRSTVSAR